MVINHLEKLFITNDSATIVQELEVQHPAAKMLVLASKMQEAENGDGTNFVVVLAGELLQLAEELLKNGLHCSEVIAAKQYGNEDLFAAKIAEACCLAMPAGNPGAFSCDNVRVAKIPGNSILGTTVVKGMCMTRGVITANITEVRNAVV